MASATRTIDHDEIRRWVESRGGNPAHVKRTGDDGDPGVLRIDFPGYSGEQSLEKMSWDEWFRAFEENQLAFLYQDEGDSRFNKLVRRTDDDESEQAENAGAASASGKTSGRRRWRSKTERVTLNDASREELDAIWGVGPQIARRILAYRRSNGPIRSRDDLMAIDGIDGATADLILKEAALD